MDIGWRVLITMNEEAQKLRLCTVGSRSRAVSQVQDSIHVRINSILLDYVESAAVA